MMQIRSRSFPERIDLTNEVIQHAIEAGEVSISGAFASTVKDWTLSTGIGTGSTSHDDDGPRVPPASIATGLQATLKYFFNKYDPSCNGYIDARFVLLYDSICSESW